MKTLRNLIARLLRQPLMPATPAAGNPEPVPRRMPARMARDLAMATVPWHAQQTQPQDEAASALQVAMLLASCSEEGIAADAGSFGLCCADVRPMASE